MKSVKSEHSECLMSNTVRNANAFRQIKQKFHSARAVPSMSIQFISQFNKKNTKKRHMNESNLSSDSSIHSTESAFLTRCCTHLRAGEQPVDGARQPNQSQVVSVFRPDSTFQSESHSIFQRVRDRSKYIVKILHFTLHSDYTKLKQTEYILFQHAVTQSHSLTIQCQRVNEINFTYLDSGLPKMLGNKTKSATTNSKRGSRTNDDDVNTEKKHTHIV